MAGTTTTNKQQTLTAASCLACVHNQIDETPLKHDIEYCVKRVEVKPAAGRPASISSGDHAKSSEDKDKENSPADTSTSNTSVDGQTSQQLSKNAKKKKRKKNNKAAAAAAVMAATATSLSATSLAPDEAQNDNAHNNSQKSPRSYVQETSSLSTESQQQENHKDVTATQQQNEMLEREVTLIINDLQELTKSKVLLHKVCFFGVLFFIIITGCLQLLENL